MNRLKIASILTILLSTGAFSSIHAFAGPSPQSLRRFFAPSELPLEPNETESQYVRGDAKKAIAVNSTLLLFVHGIFGDTLGSWGNRQSRIWDFLLEHQDFKDDYDVYAFGFRSRLLGSVSPSPSTVAQSLINKIESEGFLTKYKRIVFVAHSLGGLIVLEALRRDQRLAAAVPLVVTYGTPYDGAVISTIAKNFFRNPGLAYMVDVDKNNPFLDSLYAEWKTRKLDKTITTIVRCAYETDKTFNLGLIVPKEKARSMCDGDLTEIRADHIQLVKPTTERKRAVEFLTSMLYTLPSIPSFVDVTNSRGPFSPSCGYVIEIVDAPSGPLMGRARERFTPQVRTKGALYAEWSGNSMTVQPDARNVATTPQGDLAHVTILSQCAHWDDVTNDTQPFDPGCRYEIGVVKPWNQNTLHYQDARFATIQRADGKLLAEWSGGNKMVVQDVKRHIGTLDLSPDEAVVKVWAQCGRR